MTPGRVFHQKMRCFVQSVSYNFETRIGTAYVPDNGSTDASGTIKTFTSIDPKVQQVQVFVDGKLDIIYERAALMPADRSRRPGDPFSFGRDGVWRSRDIRHGVAQ